MTPPTLPRHADLCPDCGVPICWTKQDDIRRVWEVAGEAVILRWNKKRWWHEAVVVPTYQPHHCPGAEEPPHA